MRALTRIAVVLFIVGCTHNQPSSEELVGTYRLRIYDGAFKIELKSDGSYEEYSLIQYTSESVEERFRSREVIERGRWTTDMNKVVLTSEKGSVRLMPITEYGGVLALEYGGISNFYCVKESNNPVQVTSAKTAAPDL